MDLGKLLTNINTMAKFRKIPVVIEAFQMTKKRRSDNKD